MFSRSREAIRVKVQKHENKLPIELRKFSVDPQITSLDELRKILETAFDLRGDFTLSYKSIDGCGQEEYLALLSDWDLEAAFLRAQNASCLAGSEPCIHLKVDVKSYNSASVDNSDMQKNEIPVKHSGQTQKSPLSAEPPLIQNADPKHTQTGFQGIFMNHMEKTINLVSRAFNLSEDPDAPPRPPLKQEEFLSFLGPVGHVIQGSKLREVIYSGGIDPGCRKVIWKHILNVYPEGMSGKERLDYMKKKSAEYYSLRDVWRDCSQKEPISNDLAYVTNMVRKDVLRTDRHHKFYSGSDDNQNITFLFNILTTYALNHPTVSYCQGMSDLASPLLVVMSDEAHAYICLCALMKRLHYNFLLDGEAMTLKFSHLSESLQTYDPIFYAYLQSQQADDLLFCYRWLLLEMKREFAFEDALHMLEVLWSSLPPSPPIEELLLVEKEFCPEEPSTNSEEPPASPLLKTPRENVYTKLCAIRRQSSSYSITSSTKGRITYRRKNLSLDESIGKANFNPQLQISKEFQSLDETCVNLNEGFCSHHINNDEFKEETQSQLILNKDIDLKNIFSQEPLKLNGTLRNIHRKSQNNDLLRAAVNNKLLSNIDVNNQNNIENDSENVSKKLVKNLAEFNNFYANKKKDLDSLDLNNSESNEHQQYSEGGSENIKADSDLSDSDVDLFIPDVEKCIDQTNQENFEIFGAPESQSNQKSPLESNDNFDKTNTFNILTITKKDGKQPSSKTISSFSNKLKNDKNPFENHQISDKNDVFIWENPLHGKCDIKKINNFHKFTENVDKLQDSNDEVFATEDSTSLQDKKTDEQDDASKEIDKKSKISARNAMRSNSKFFSNMSQELENAKKNCEILLSNKRCTNLQTIASTITNFQKKYELQNQTSVNANDRVNSTSNSCEEVDEANATKSTVLNLPPANLFGGGNPFLIFLCLTVLIQHRDYIMRSQMDYNELAMYFDKMVRKHNVHRVLNQARRMYSAYVKEQNSNVNS